MKKKILMLAVAACLIVLSIASSSLAYFTDTDTKANVFTSGNVDITLNYENDVTTKFFPGMTYEKTATITLKDTSDDAYVGAIITLTTTNTANTALLTNSISSIFNGLTVTNSVLSNDGKTLTIYVVNNAALTQNATTFTLFNGITIPAQWTETEMAVFNTMNISVTAYATQTVFTTQSGINSAAAALKAAFPTVW